MSNKSVAFRVDANSRIGAGHLMRCLALAEYCCERLDISFVCLESDPSMVELVKARGFKIFDFEGAGGITEEQDARISAQLIKGDPPSVVVVDNYKLGAHWEDIIRQCTNGLVVAIDDKPNRKHKADILIDQTIGRTNIEYKDIVPENCLLLTGPKYILLSKSFLNSKFNNRNENTFKKRFRILVSLGGFPQLSIMREICEALEFLNLIYPIKLIVPVLKNNETKNLKNFLLRKFSSNVEIYEDCTDMAHVISSCDLGIGAGGFSVWERAHLGLPCITLCLADNQRDIVERAVDAGVTISVESGKLFSKNLFQLLKELLEDKELKYKLTHNSMKLVDGRGPMRVVSEIENLNRDHVRNP